MIKILSYIFVGLMVSFFFFPFSFTFLPYFLNTKVMLALIGVFIYSYDILEKKEIKISPVFFGATLISIVFSLICFSATVVNTTEDYSYATYFLSFAVWSFSAYTVCCIIRYIHNEANIKLLTNYLMSVCAIQCIIALAIDNHPTIKSNINLVVEQSAFFMEEINRLYGIGASLDPAGVRFGIVLILISSVLCFDNHVKHNKTQIMFYLSCFAVITVIGNMISRTTSVGLLFSLPIFAFALNLHKLRIKSDDIKLYSIIAVCVLAAVIVSTYFYNENPYFKSQLRFAFEGFFNWVEQGEWRTASTDKLNREMWVWPTDTKTWIIGSGLFDNFIYSTDIGYCRFILYCGITGFSVFALFFVYNARVFALRFYDYRYTFFVFMILSFVYWIKVSTDIFQIYALMFFLDIPLKDVGKINNIPVNEDNLQYSSNL